jgi:hypothetical protein
MNLYLAECLTLGPLHPIKVGVSKNPYRRMHQLRSMGVQCAGLRAIFIFPNKKEAMFVERQCCKTFKRSWVDMMISPEILDVSLQEISAFVQSFNPLYSIILETKHG